MDKKKSNPAEKGDKKIPRRVRDSENAAAERQERNDHLNQERVEYFKQALDGTLPHLRALQIDKSKTSLQQDQQIAVARLVQAGHTARIVLHSAGDTSIKLPEALMDQDKGTESGTVYDIILNKLKEQNVIDPENMTPKQKRKVRQIMNEGTDARNLMIHMNIGLITMFVNREQRRRGLDSYTYEELIEEAKIGMIHAIDRYDPDSGYKFSTYAGWLVKQKTMDYLNSKSKIIRMPANMNTVYRRMTVAMKDLRQQYPSDEMIKPEIIYQWMKDQGWDITLKMVQNAIAYKKETISMDAFVTDDDNRTIDDTIASDEDIAEDTTKKIDSTAAFNNLIDMIHDPITRDIVQTVYTQGNEKDAKQIGELAKKHNLTTKEVQDRLNQAIADIKQTLSFIGLTQQDLIQQ